MRADTRRDRAEIARLRHECVLLAEEVERLRAERRVLEATVESEHRLRMESQRQAARRARN